LQFVNAGTICCPIFSAYQATEPRVDEGEIVEGESGMIGFSLVDRSLTIDLWYQIFGDSQAIKKAAGFFGVTETAAAYKSPKLRSVAT